MNCNNGCNFCGNGNYTTWILILFVILIFTGGLNGCGYNNCDC